MTDKLGEECSKVVAVENKQGANQKTDQESTNVDTFAVKGLNKWVWRGAFFSPLTSYLLGGYFGNINLMGDVLAFSLCLFIVLTFIIMKFNGKVIVRDDPNDLPPTAKFFVLIIALVQMLIIGNSLGVLLITCIWGLVFNK